MHYKNGREAKAGDRVVMILKGVPAVSGILHSVQEHSETCNGRIAATTSSDPFINIKDCLHVDDVAAATVPDTTK